MRQIKNYLSKVYDIKRVLLIGKTEEFHELASWILNKKNIEEVYYCPKDGSEVCPELSRYCTIEHMLTEKKQVDAIIFDRGCRDKAVKIWEWAPRYLIGRLDKEEEYFDLWEKYRERSDYIYLARQKEIAPEENINDANKCEILEWQKGKTDIELSVILPVYNVKEHLPTCIKSLLDWKAPYVEYIFVNDGSTDGSEEIIKEYGKKDDRIRLIDKENAGCASARNRGIEKARGKYLGFVDSDDFIDEMMFYKLLRRILLGNFDLAYCGYKEYYEQSKETSDVLNDCLKEPYLSGTYRQDKVQRLAVNTRVALWRCIYKKNVIDDNQIRFCESLKRFDDLPFRVEYIFAAKSAVCISEHLYYYRLGRQGQDVSCSDEGFFVHFDIFEHLDKYVDSFKDSRMTDLLQIIKLQTHGFALSKIRGVLRREYIRKAKTQMDRNMGYFRTVCLMLIYTGKGNLWWYTRMKLFN